jgi:hypothetical protein
VEVKLHRTLSDAGWVAIKLDRFGTEMCSALPVSTALLSPVPCVLSYRVAAMLWLLPFSSRDPFTRTNGSDMVRTPFLYVWAPRSLFSLFVYRSRSSFALNSMRETGPSRRFTTQAPYELAGNEVSAITWMYVQQSPANLDQLGGEGRGYPDYWSKKVALKLNSVVLVRKRTIPIERPPLAGEVSANFCG